MWIVNYALDVLANSTKREYKKQVLIVGQFNINICFRESRRDVMSIDDNAK